MIIFIEKSKVKLCYIIINKTTIEVIRSTAAVTTVFLAGLDTFS